ncbi:hypothetical protein CBUD_0725a [Coxiella burnetii Dugway 5J108-111]|uniref:Uncharacterized protein n=1 Tax=Coxiella burnetii (strain Dugway 5J108-111) TaxID=434922 RepID=B5XHA3_COXBN|nr:hypothetical protein CBUD_0725a [Coxiella burnetii Dugway 5J108-111]
MIALRDRQKIKTVKMQEFYNYPHLITENWGVFHVL